MLVWDMFDHITQKNHIKLPGLLYRCRWNVGVKDGASALGDWLLEEILCVFNFGRADVDACDAVGEFQERDEVSTLAASHFQDPRGGIDRLDGLNVGQNEPSGADALLLEILVSVGVARLHGDG